MRREQARPVLRHLGKHPGAFSSQPRFTAGCYPRDPSLAGRRSLGSPPVSSPVASESRLRIAEVFGSIRLLHIPPVRELDHKDVIRDCIQKAPERSIELKLPRSVHVAPALGPDEICGRTRKVLPPQDGISPE